jgi:hypothetical protein
MFKSYSRKSSAIVGAERAGFDPSFVTQHEGKWGFFVVAPVVAIEPTNVVTLKTHPRVKQPALGDRRKVLRGVYRGLKSIQRENKKPDQPKFSVDFLRASAQRLRQSYRAADIARA